MRQYRHGQGLKASMGFSKRTTCAIAIWCVTVLGEILSGIAIAVNRTIDDNYGDSVTGDLPVYSPPDLWTPGGCPLCLAQPDRTRALGQSANFSIFD